MSPKVLLKATHRLLSAPARLNALRTAHATAQWLTCARGVDIRIGDTLLQRLAPQFGLWPRQVGGQRRSGDVLTQRSRVPGVNMFGDTVFADGTPR